MAEETPSEESTIVVGKEFGCTSCGAKLHYQPGTRQLKCTHCGAMSDIVDLPDGPEEQDYEAVIKTLEATKKDYKITSLHCNSCGATTTPDPKTSGTMCPYCASPLVNNAMEESMIAPHGVLPFKLTSKEAQDAFKKWLHGLWFAPNKLVHAANDIDKLKGVYTPYWTFDSHTVTQYIGQRGEYYWVTVSYNTVENGQTVSRTRQERRTRWYPASGTVVVDFDDVLVLGSNSLPRKYTEKLEPWDLESTEKFQTEYLGGFITEKYQVELPDGFGIAKEKMDPGIRSAICRDIGGDEQTIQDMSVKYEQVKFKHILLPLYISSFIFSGETFRFVINARTGEVSGERPYSAWKIFFAVLALIAAVLAVIGIANK